jgi:UDP-glucose 4-epimerase
MPAMLFVIGGSGFIGTHAAKEFLDNGEQVAINTHRSARDAEILRELFDNKVTVVQLDMTDGPAVHETFERLGVTSICNLLAPPPGRWDVSEEYRANVTGLLNALEAGHKLGVRRFTQASSVAVYAQNPGPVHKEDDPLPMSGRNSTEAFKKAEEVLGGFFADQKGMDFAVVRFSGIYGPLYHSMQNLPSRVAHAAVKGRELPLQRDGQPLVYADDGGDSCFVKDAARGLRLVHNAPKLAHRVYNIAGGQPVRNRDVVQAASKAKPGWGVDLPAGLRPGSRGATSCDVSRAKADVGYEPAYDITRGMAEYMSWLETHAE